MKGSPPDLAALVLKARDGDLSAQDALIRAYQDRIAAFVFALTGHASLVEDLAQTIFLRVVLKLKRLREVDKFEPWLFRLARNACRDHFRREKWRRLFQPFAVEHEELPAPAPPSADLENFLHALPKLPPAQRELLVLLQENEWSYAELASITGTTESSVKSKLFRARQELKKLLSSDE